nr:ABC transporter permease [Halegenticoccus soli]
MFGQVAGQAVGGPGGSSEAYLTFLVPAIVIQVALIAAASSGIGLVDDMERGLFEKVLVSPMSRTAVFLGKTLSEMLRITVQVVLILLLGYVLGACIATSVSGALGILGITLLSGTRTNPS